MEFKHFIWVKLGVQVNIICIVVIGDPYRLTVCVLGERITAEPPKQNQGVHQHELEGEICT